MGETLLVTMRRDWPFLARFSGGGHGDPGIPFRPALLLLLAAAFAFMGEPGSAPATQARLRLPKFPQSILVALMAGWIAHLAFRRG